MSNNIANEIEENEAEKRGKDKKNMSETIGGYFKKGGRYIKEGLVIAGVYVGKGIKSSKKIKLFFKPVELLKELWERMKNLSRLNPIP